MAAKDFDFTTKKTKEIENQQAIVALDSDVDIAILLKTLKSENIRVISKGQDSGSAMEAARKHKRGLFFLDYDIKALGSNAILTKLKLECSGIKVVVLAKKLNKIQVSDARNLGVVGFLAKPLNEDAIKKILSKF